MQMRLAQSTVKSVQHQSFLQPPLTCAYNHRPDSYLQLTNQALDPPLPQIPIHLAYLLHIIRLPRQLQPPPLLHPQPAQRLQKHRDLLDRLTEPAAAQLQREPLQPRHARQRLARLDPLLAAGGEVDGFHGVLGREPVAGESPAELDAADAVPEVERDGGVEVREGPGVAEFEDVEGVEEVEGFGVAVLVQAWSGLMHGVWLEVGACIWHPGVDACEDLHLLASYCQR